MTIEINGNKVVVHDGPQETEHKFASHELAVEFAAAEEVKRIRLREQQVAALREYSDPDHPATPVMPAPDEINQAAADLAMAKNPGTAQELPPLGDAPKIESAELQQAGHEALVAAESSDVEPPEPAVLVDSEFTYDYEKKKLNVVLTSNSAGELILTRQVFSSDGSLDKSAEVTLDPYRKMSRTYKASIGWRFAYSINGNVVAEFKVVGKPLD